MCGTENSSVVPDDCNALAPMCQWDGNRRQCFYRGEPPDVETIEVRLHPWIMYIGYPMIGRHRRILTVQVARWPRLWRVLGQKLWGFPRLKHPCRA